jgi:hypothetical protein
MIIYTKTKHRRLKLERGCMHPAQVSTVGGSEGQAKRLHAFLLAAVASSIPAVHTFKRLEKTVLLSKVEVL